VTVGEMQIHPRNFADNRDDNPSLLINQERSRRVIEVSTGVTTGAFQIASRKYGLGHGQGQGQV
jgi:hypothetical protein